MPKNRSLARSLVFFATARVTELSKLLDACEIVPYDPLCVTQFEAHTYLMNNGLHYLFKKKNIIPPLGK